MLANVLTLLVILCLLGICYPVGKKVGTETGIIATTLMGILAVGSGIIVIVYLVAGYTYIYSCVDDFIN